MTTIYDVAKAAGVSPKTVSRVLNGDAPVKAPTRTAVERAIADLGYVPSSAARAMRSNRTGLLGVLTGAISVASTDPADSGLPEVFIVQGIQRALESAGMTLLIADTGGRTDKAVPLMRTFSEHRVEGLIHVADYHRKVDLPRPPGGAPLVLANCYDHHGTPCVLPDDRAGQRALTESVIAAGHRRIAYLSLAADLDATRLRTEGYRDALRAAGIPIDPDLLVPADILTRQSDHIGEVAALRAALDKVLSLDAPPTVLMCGNDRLALRAYGMLRSRGLRIPQDIGVAGYDNYALIAESLYPRLSTAELPYVAMGERAAQLMLDLIGRGEAASLPSKPVLVGGPVCWRDSIADHEEATHSNHKSDQSRSGRRLQ